MTTKLVQYTINAQGGISEQTWIDVPAGGTPAWGAITGILSAQTDLQSALDAKQKTITQGIVTFDFGSAPGTNIVSTAVSDATIGIKE